MRRVVVVVWWACLALAPVARADDPLASVRARVASDPERALSTLDALGAAAAANPELRYLRSRLLQRLGHTAQALAALPDDLAALPDAVRVDVRARRAVLLASTGDCGAATALVAALEREKVVTPALVGAAVECALAAGDVKHARRRLDSLAGRDQDSFALRLRLADVLQAQGARDEAARELRALLVTAPDHALAPEAERRFGLLGGAPLSLDERAERAERLTRARRPEAALVELGETPPRVKEAQARWWHLRGMALFAMRTRYAEASRALTRAARLGGATVAADAFHAARALARSGEDRAAVAAYRRLVERYPKSRFASEARYLAADVALRLGLPRAERDMRAFVDGPGARDEPTLASEGLFQLGLRAFAQRRFREAEDLFQRHARRGGDTMARARGSYWVARAAQAAGRRVLAVERYRATIAVEALHWYALLSAARLRALGEDPGDPFVADADGGASVTTRSAKHDAPAMLASVALPAEVDFYARLGLLEDAVGALRAAEPSLRGGGAGDAALARAYRDLGEYPRPVWLASHEHGELLARPAAPDNAWAWEAAYPRPYADAVATAARDAKLDADLIHAVMRKESEFDPSVVSYADAIGLMQLLPKTAEKIARARREEYRRELLFDPATSIRWGAHYLGNLNRQFDGQSLLAVAAYNAGEHKVEPWLAHEARGGKVELDLFVERIPIEQTRNYVRRVACAWARYAYLRDPARGWPLELPTTLHR